MMDTALRSLLEWPWLLSARRGRTKLRILLRRERVILAKVKLRTTRDPESYIQQLFTIAPYRISSIALVEGPGLAADRRLADGRIRFVQGTRGS
jgi:hypothetical protein